MIVDEERPLYCLTMELTSEEHNGRKRISCAYISYDIPPAQSTGNYHKNTILIRLSSKETKTATLTYSSSCLAI